MDAEHNCHSSHGACPYIRDSLFLPTSSVGMENGTATHEKQDDLRTGHDNRNNLLDTNHLATDLYISIDNELRGLSKVLTPSDACRGNTICSIPCHPVLWRQQQEQVEPINLSPDEPKNHVQYISHHKTINETKLEFSITQWKQEASNNIINDRQSKVFHLMHDERFTNPILSHNRCAG